MKYQLVGLLLAGLCLRLATSSCVWVSDFGFKLNCGFKKSSLFRVRNLGGVKAHVGLGFSVADELGLGQLSLSSQDEQDQAEADAAAEAATMATAGGSRRSVDVGQPPLFAAQELKSGSQTGRSHSINTRTPLVRGSNTRQTVPPFRPIAPGNNSGMIAVPAFAVLPPSIARIPTASAPQTSRPLAPVVFHNALQMANRRFQLQVPNGNSLGIASQSTMGKLSAVPASNTLVTRTLASQTPAVPSISLSDPSPLLMGHSIASLAQASNISVEAIAAALRVRQQQLLYNSTTTTTTTTTTVQPPTRTVRPKYSLAGPNRVMNAPKEHYPVGYDKNYDDNFTSKVDLPETSFSCSDQKHFPGLYADEDLGCMVFHVCAFTDDGLVMKSFLCPESTLFDQTILKCNWWFYVDCKVSKKLYDSNIPISKSYQLMKALAFFSSYKNQTSTNNT